MWLLKQIEVMVSVDMVYLLPLGEEQKLVGIKMIPRYFVVLQTNPVSMGQPILLNKID